MRPICEIEYVFIARQGGGAFAPPALLELSALCPDLGNVFRFDSQPFQETLVCRWVTCLKHLMPLFHLRVVQANLLEHSNPFVYVHLVLHMPILCQFDAVVQFCDGVHTDDRKV